MSGNLREHIFPYLLRHRVALALLVVTTFLATRACSSTPHGVDVRPIISLHLNAGPDFLKRIQTQLGGRAADWSRDGVGYLVYRLPNTAPAVPIFRNIDFYREENPLKAQEIYTSVPSRVICWVQ